MTDLFLNENYRRKAKIWVVIATHKLYSMPKDKMYIPLHVGAEGKTDEAGQPLDFGYQKDNTGDNISDKNAQFCELTGLYWAWKNLSSDYLGLVHYRRHFVGLKKIKVASETDRVLTYKEIKPYLNKYKVIVPKKRHYYIETLEQHYAHNHRIEELNTARDIMLEKYPEYKDAYDIAIHRTWGYMFNMMILERSLMDEYCAWIFDILFELEKRLVDDSGSLSDFENRFPGRVSERLFNVWLTYQIQERKIKKEEIMEIPFMYTEKINLFNKGMTFLKAKFLGKKPEKSF